MLTQFEKIQKHMQDLQTRVKELEIIEKAYYSNNRLTGDSWKDVEIKRLQDEAEATRIKNETVIMRLKIAIDELRGSLDKAETENLVLKKKIDEYIHAEVRSKHMLKMVKKNTNKYREISFMQLEEVHSLKGM